MFRINAFLMFFAVAAPASAQDYPAVEVLTAFDDACSQLDSRADTMTAISEAGWESIRLGPEHSFFSAHQAAAIQQGNSNEIQGFEKVIAGRTLALILAEESAEHTLRFCVVRDSSAHAPISAEAIEEWSGEQPLSWRWLGSESHNSTFYGTWQGRFRLVHTNYFEHGSEGFRGMPFGITVRTMWTDAPRSPPGSTPMPRRHPTPLPPPPIEESEQ